MVCSRTKYSASGEDKKFEHIFLTALGISIFVSVHAHVCMCANFNIY